MCIHSRHSELKGKTFRKNAPDWTEFNNGVEVLIAIKEYQKNSWRVYKFPSANIRKQDCRKSYKSRFTKEVVKNYFLTYTTGNWGFSIIPWWFYLWDLGSCMVLTLCLSRQGEALVNKTKCKAKKWANSRGQPWTIDFLSKFLAWTIHAVYWTPKNIWDTCAKTAVNNSRRRKENESFPKWDKAKIQILRALPRAGWSTNEL